MELFFDIEAASMQYGKFLTFLWERNVMREMKDESRNIFSKFFTSIKRQTTPPLLESIIGSTLSFAVINTQSTPITVAVHADAYPSVEDWRRFAEFQVHAINTYNAHRTIVWVPSNKTPNKKQARQFIKMMEDNVDRNDLRFSIFNPAAKLPIKFVAESLFFLKTHYGPENGLNIKFYSEEDEALHHILLEPTSSAAKNVLVTVEYLFDMTMKAARSKKKA